MACLTSCSGSLLNFEHVKARNSRRTEIHVFITCRSCIYWILLKPNIYIYLKLGIFFLCGLLGMRMWTKQNRTKQKQANKRKKNEKKKEAARNKKTRKYDDDDADDDDDDADDYADNDGGDDDIGLLR